MAKKKLFGFSITAIVHNPDRKLINWRANYRSRVKRGKQQFIDRGIKIELRQVFNYLW